MKDNWICSKVENCFVNAKTFEYLFSFPITEEWVVKAADKGMLRIKRNLRRPCYFIEFASGVQIKGNLNEKRIKISYPECGFEIQKNQTEQQLKEWCK